jgi:hypothetical protein
MGNVTVKAPCCSSIRECHVRTKYVISLEDGEVVRTIEAVRCYRGEEKKYFIEVSRPIAVVEHYVSNRGVHYITVEYSDWDKERTLEVVRHALGLETEEKIVV